MATQFAITEKAPKGYVPNVHTEHQEVPAAMRQTFPGGKLVFELDKKPHGEARVIVCGNVLGRFVDLTIQQWGDLLYTLETRFSKYIIA